MCLRGGRWYFELNVLSYVPCLMGGQFEQVTGSWRPHLRRAPVLTSALLLSICLCLCSCSLTSIFPFLLFLVLPFASGLGVTKVRLGAVRQCGIRRLGPVLGLELGPEDVHVRWW